MRRYIGAALLLIAVPGGALASFFDDFNRADGPLGANYNLVSGTQPVINAGMAAGAASGNGLTLVSSSVFTGAYDQTIVSADVSLADSSTTLAYVALSLGSDATTTSGHGLFIKVQRQGGSNGGFNTIGFYTGAGSNNTSAVVTTGGNFQTLTTQFSRGRMTIKTTSATNLYTGIDTNFDNVDDIVYNSTLVLGPLVVGNRVGLHIYGTLGRMDNYSATNPVPEPATMAVLGLGALALMRRRRK